MCHQVIGTRPAAVGKVSPTVSNLNQDLVSDFVSHGIVNILEIIDIGGNINEFRAGFD